MIVNERKMCEEAVEMSSDTSQYGLARCDRSDIFLKFFGNFLGNFLVIFNFFIRGCNGSPEPVSVCLKLKVVVRSNSQFAFFWLK